MEPAPARAADRASFHVGGCPSSCPHDCARCTGDLAGATVAALCAVHCALLPVLLLLAPTLAGSWIADERLDWLLLATAGVLGLATVVPGTARHHRRWHPLLLLGAGLAVLVAARATLAEESAAGIATVVAGAALLAAAHLRNRSLVRAAVRQSSTAAPACAVAP